MYKSEYYGLVSETYCQSQHTDVSMQSNQTNVNSLPYWSQTSPQQQQQQQPQQQQQSSPNHINYSSGASYGSNQHTETVYHGFQPNAPSVYQTNADFNGTVNSNNVSSQDVYQYSPYSGDLLQPEDIFQMDQPIRSANVSSLNGMSASPPATLLDLGSGTIEQKSIPYSHSELSDSYYSLNDDNSTNSSHNADPNCFYQNHSESTMHLHNGVNGTHNHNNNNPNMISMNAMDASATATAAAATHASYYCDTRNETNLSRQYAKHSPTMLSPNESACDRITNGNYQTACYSNNNNNNNSAAAINNNIHENYKNQKRKASEAFGQSPNHFNSFNSTIVSQHEYYGGNGGSVEHLSSNLTNLELHQNHEMHTQYANTANCSPIVSEYCGDPVLTDSHGNQCLTYYDSETNNLVQLSTNSYEISVVSSN